MPTSTACEPFIWEDRRLALLGASAESYPARLVRRASERGEFCALIASCREAVRESRPRRLVVQKTGAEDWAAPQRCVKPVGRKNDHGTKAQIRR